VANVGDPASGKTPAMEAVLGPYQALQFKLLNEYAAKKAAFAKAKADREKVAEENRGLDEGQKKPLPPLPDEPPPPERFVAVDATVESLAPLLAENPRGLLMAQDEGVGWVKGMGQYKGGRGNDRQFWLSTFSGKSHLVDRKGQGLVPISIARPFVNVVCGFPPDMLNELADGQGRNDGFLHRVLFTFPRAAAGTAWTDVTIDQQAKEAWEATLSGLRKLAMRELDDGALGYQVVQLSPDARDAWVAWWDAHAAEMCGPDLALPLIGPWGKLRSYAPRLALVLHYLWLVQSGGEEGDLKAASIERAVRLVNYFKAHLRRVYGRLRHSPEDNHLAEVLDWLRRQKGAQCTVRDVLAGRKAPNSEKAKKLLRELEERGYGTTEWRAGKSGRKVAWFVFDPRL
jgi:hypothetical protein